EVDKYGSRELRHHDSNFSIIERFCLVCQSRRCFWRHHVSGEPCSAPICLAIGIFPGRLCPCGRNAHWKSLWCARCTHVLTRGKGFESHRRHYGTVFSLDHL